MWLFTKEAATGIVRTVVPMAYGWLLVQWPVLTDFLPGVAPEGLAVIIGGVLYSVIRVVAEKWSWVGYFLIFNTKPAYDV